MDARDSLVAVTLNASIDKRYHLEAVVPNTVMRVAECEYSAGGKGLNVARVARQLGVRVRATGFLAGHAGNYIAEQIVGAGVEDGFVRVAGESRSCINIVDATGASTELLEPGPAVTEADLVALEARLGELAATAGVVTMSGSLPPGCPADTYARLVRRVHNAGALAIVDTSGRALEDVLAAAPDAIKPNAEELTKLTGEPVTTPDEAARAALGLIRTHALPLVLVSLGHLGALCVTAEAVWWCEPPTLEPVNTVGCGDSMVAAFATALLAGATPPEALTRAVEVSAGAALSLPTGWVEQPDIDQVRRSGVRLHQLANLDPEG